MTAMKPRGDFLCGDREYFREPSELCAPLLQALNRPLCLTRQMTRDKMYLRLWLEDMRYTQACRFFDARRPPVPMRLEKFGGPLVKQARNEAHLLIEEKKGLKNQRAFSGPWHWPFPDPAAVQGTDAEKLEAFRKIRDLIEDRLLNAPGNSIDFKLLLKHYR